VIGAARGNFAACRTKDWHRGDPITFTGCASLAVSFHFAIQPREAGEV
jgi:hypothetical protein